MNDVFFDYLNDFVSAYINDILIYNNFKTEHMKHVKKMFQRLRDAKLQTNINKCEFFVHETKYLKLIVERDEIKMNSFKMKTILQWFTSKNLKHVQKFLEFCNFCYVTTCKKHRSIYRERSFRLISSSVAARRITTSSSCACRLLLASYDSQSSMIIILRLLFFEFIFVHKKRFESKDLSKMRSDRSRRVTSSTRRRVIIDS
jgi:hypothetical protein